LIQIIILVFGLILGVYFSAQFYEGSLILIGFVVPFSIGLISVQFIISRQKSEFSEIIKRSMDPDSAREFEIRSNVEDSYSLNRFSNALKDNFDIKRKMHSWFLENLIEIVRTQERMAHRAILRANYVIILFSIGLSFLLAYHDFALGGFEETIITKLAMAGLFLALCTLQIIFLTAKNVQYHRVRGLIIKGTRELVETLIHDIVSSQNHFTFHNIFEYRISEIREIVKSGGSSK